MNVVIKIVEGPNKGAEIALPEGVAVTLGKGDDCDIVLADATLPDAPLSIEATASGVTVGGEPLAPFAVKTAGATSFAVGPADKAWEPLKWPEVSRSDAEVSRRGAEVSRRGAEEAETQRETASHRDAETAETQSDESLRASAPLRDPSLRDPSPREKKRRGVGCGCLVVLFLLFVVFAALVWFFRDRDEVKPWLDKAQPYAERGVNWTSRLVKKGWSRFSATDSSSNLQPSNLQPSTILSALAARHGLSLTNRTGRAVLVGDFATRAERLRATAEAYAAQPGIELDFADDESLKTAAEDTLAMLSESRLRVVAATNRVVALSGRAANLRRALDALSADIPKLRNVDVAGIESLKVGKLKVESSGAGGADPQDASSRPLRASAASASLRDKKALSLPVCGILTTPYPCLVLRSGARVMEGAPFGDWTVAKIAADSVTLTNAEGSVTWKP